MKLAIKESKIINPYRRRIKTNNHIPQSLEKDSLIYENSGILLRGKVAWQVTPEYYYSFSREDVRSA